jgi:hypothetical protein
MSNEVIQIQEDGQVVVTLVSYPLAKKGAIADAIRKATGLVGEVPTLPCQIGRSVRKNTAKELSKSLTALGAQVRLEPPEPSNVFYHPAFGNAPVFNAKRRGPKKGTISLNSERRKRLWKKAATRQVGREADDSQPTDDIVQALEEMKPHIEGIVFALGRFSAAYIALKNRLAD